MRNICLGEGETPLVPNSVGFSPAMTGPWGLWVALLCVGAVVAVDVPCDVVIVGGSAAALAVVAGLRGAAVQACLLEPTAWAGGQLNTVPAIDFGEWNVLPENQPQSFRELLSAVGSPGGCWVSYNCLCCRRRSGLTKQALCR